MALSSRYSMLFKIVFWALCLSIFVGALLPNDVAQPVFPHSDKALHAAVFGCLTFVGCAAYSPRFLTITLFLVFLGGAIEVAQGFAPGRAQEVADFIADLIGIVLGLLIRRAVFR
jgi:VanZ family protein